MRKGLKKVISLLLVVVMAFGMAAVTPVKITKADSTQYIIKVNLGTNCTTIYKGKKAVKAMICSPSAETPTGTFYVPIKYRWHEMIGNCYAQYCTRITTGVLFHSVWYYKNGDKSTMSVSAYNVMGQKASHGCVRLLCKDAKWIYDHCAVGTKIVIFWGDKSDDPLKRPGFTPITNGKFTDWDPTDPDPKNPYKKKVPSITVKDKNIEFGSKIKPIDLVTVKDSAGNTVTKNNGKIKVKGKINTKKLGTYKVKYSVKDSLGKKKKATFQFKVVDTKKPKIKGAKAKSNVALGRSLNVLSGVKASSVSGKDLTSKIKVSVKRRNKKVSVKKGIVNFNKTGTYKITYKVKGQNKKTAVKTVKYKVNDQRVQFALNAKSVTLNQNDIFNYKNYIKMLNTFNGKALDIDKNVKYTGIVDTAKPGVYVITYTAQNGMKTYTARTIKLTVTVKGTVTPENPEEETTEGETGNNANSDEGWTDLH